MELFAHLPVRIVRSVDAIFRSLLELLLQGWLSDPGATTCLEEASRAEEAALAVVCCGSSPCGTQLACFSPVYGSLRAT